jgi:hypothetical protein
MHPYLSGQFAAERQADLLARATQQDLVRQARAARRTTQARPARLPGHPLHAVAWVRTRTTMMA